MSSDELSSPLLAESAAARRAVLSGIAVSSGIAVGRAHFLNRRRNLAEAKRVSPRQARRELERLEQACLSLALEFEEAKGLLAGNALSPAGQEQADLLDAYVMLCRDPKLLNTAGDMIRRERLNAEWAWEQAVLSVAGAFDKLADPYLRERAEDVRSVGSRVMERLRGERPRGPGNSSRGEGGEDGEGGEEEGRIIFAHDLTPADTLTLALKSVSGLGTEMGGHTSHTGILARGLGMPCVVGVSGLEEAACEGGLVIVDGIQGFVIVNPDERDLQEYAERQEQFLRYERRIRQEAKLPAETGDGERVAVYGNLEMPDETSRLLSLGGEGVGLYRTEYGYLSRLDLPTEDELYEDYAAVLRAMRPRPVVLRTLDVGADKSLGGSQPLEEANPALGLRAIRYSLRRQDIFRRQLRAILRAGAQGNAALMFPLISGLRELRQAKSILGEARQELDNQGLAYDRNMPVGVMVELPSAVFQAQDLAAEADFFSIGANDLIQYTLAIDRGNKYVSHLYQPLHPAVLQAIRLVVDAGHAAGISVCICGEMASDPYCLPVLLAMGLDEFSVTPQAIPVIKHMIRNFDAEELRELLRRVYNSSSVRITTRLIRQHIYGRFRAELDFISQLSDAEH